MHLYLDNDTTYALSNTTRKLVHIDEVDRGLACNCICPCCKQPMIANKGEKNHHYFSHERKAGTSIDAKKCRIITMHMVAEKIIAENKSVMLPPYYDFEKSRKISFVRVEIEERNDRSDIQPDIVGITDDGKRYLIEIKYTHEIDSKKMKKIFSEDLTCVEIDISNQKMNELETFLLDKSNDRVWINNKYGFDSIVDYYKKRGKDVRVIQKQMCKFKENSFYPLCQRFINEISHKGTNFVICDNIECSYTIAPPTIAPRKETSTQAKDISRIKRETKPITLAATPTFYIPQHEEYPPFKPQKADDECNYRCMPNSSSSLDEYFHNIHMNKVFYEEEGKCYKVLNYFRLKNIIGVVLVMIQGKEKYHAGYVLISKTTSFIHSWSRTYSDEHTATLSLKSRLNHMKVD